MGFFLSGGYDSFLVTTITQEHSDTPVKAFSIGFHKKYNEAECAGAAARYLETNQTEAYIGEEDMYNLVNSMP